MNKRILTAMILASCCGASLLAREGNARIAAVENGFQPAFILRSEQKKAPCWTLRERMAFHKVPGMSVAIIDNGRIDWTKAYGVADAGSSRAVDTNTLFQAASIGKVVTAATVLALVERGRLDLDADISTYLRSWRIPASDFAKKSNVTLSALLSHTAGFRKGRSGEFEYDFPLPTLIQLLNGESPSPHPPVTLINEPGTVWQYSNVGFYIIQLVLEDVYGKPFPEIVAEMVLRPLGMTRSFYMQRLTPELESNAAFAHDRDGNLIRGRYHVYPAFGSGTGFWSTPGDLARLALELYKAFTGRPNPLFSRKLAMRMSKPVLGHYGLGLFTQPRDRCSAFHLGDTTGYHNILRIHLSRGCGFVVMTNGDNGTRLYDELQRAIAGEYAGQPGRMAVKRPIVLKDMALKALEGQYGDGLFPPLNVMVISGRLVSDHFTSPGAELQAENRLKFFSTLQGVGYEFALDELGKATQVIVTYLGNGYVCRRLGAPERPIIGTLIPIIMKEGVQPAIAALLRLKGKNPAEYNWGKAQVNSLGYELISRNRLDDAIAVFQFNALTYPSVANTHDSLGEAYALRGERTKAITCYEKALELDPDSESARKALESLKKQPDGK
jgi:CubicO group peptidase (beta-lactamase class C family)